MDDSPAITSPNFNERACPVSMLVLHYTGMADGPSAIAKLCDPDAAVSAHYVVEEDGNVLNLVPEDMRAWHAGVSYWNGIKDVNSASIGIEIVNGGHDFGLPDFPQEQINAVIALCRGILHRHDIPWYNIVGHNEVAPDRKTDPGEKFPWTKLAASGIGYWPNGDVPPLPDDQAALRQAFTALGYDVDMALLSGAAHGTLISEFQRRYLPQSVTGTACKATRSLMADLLAKRTSTT